MAKTKKRDRDIRFTRKELFVFVSFVFVAMGTMFVLGIYVGRGMSPVTFDIEDLQKELVSLKEAMVRAEDAQKIALEKELARQGDYDFYKQVRNPTGDLMFPTEETLKQDSSTQGEAPVYVTATKERSRVERPPTVQELPKPAPAATRPQPAPTPSKKDAYDFWTIQIAAMDRESDASKMVDKFIKMGYPAYMLKANPKPGKTIYRVRMGHFEARSEAEVLAARLKNDWKDYLIIKK